MEAYIDISNHRTVFADKQSFDDYWTLVSKRCDRKTRERSAIKEGKISQDYLNKKRARSKQHYYNSKDSLLRYARKYQKRYQPSTEKLRRQLMGKCDNESLCNEVVLLFNDIINDDALALLQAESMRNQGKNIRAIQQKLKQRFFSQASIDRCLTVLKHDGDSIWEPDILDKKISQLKRKGLSQQSILQKLCDSAADRPVVQAAIQKQFADDGDDENLAKLVDKLQQRNVDAEKIIKRLMAKGFRYSDIKAALT